MTFELSSPVLKVLGFEAALAAWLRVEIEDKHGIRTEFYDDGQPKPMDENLKVMLFRSIRELLTNSVKHACAHLIRLAIVRERFGLDQQYPEGMMCLGHRIEPPLFQARQLWHIRPCLR